MGDVSAKGGDSKDARRTVSRVDQRQISTRLRNYRAYYSRPDRWQKIRRTLVKSAPCAHFARDAS